MKSSLIVLIVLFALDSFAVSLVSFDPTGNICSFEKFMSLYVRSQTKASKINSFLVSDGTAHPEGAFWVYWPQNRELILVSWPANDCRSPNLLVRKHLSLMSDVVKTESEIKGSTFLVTEDWVKNVLYDAAKSKFHFSITK